MLGGGSESTKEHTWARGGKGGGDSPLPEGLPLFNNVQTVARPRVPKRFLPPNDVAGTIGGRGVGLPGGERTTVIMPKNCAYVTK